jgi:hypothetical protein
MKTLIENVFLKLKNIWLFILVLIGQILVFFTISTSSTRKTNLIHFLNGHNFCNFVIMVVVFILVISKLVNIELIRKELRLGLESTSAKKSDYIGKLIYMFKLMIFSSCITFFELLILVHKFGYMKFSYILMLKQSFYPLIGYLPFFTLQFSILMLINKKGVSFASGVIGYFLGVLGSVGISLKAGIFDIWAYPFYTAPVITDSVSGISVENEMSIILMLLSIIVSAIIIFISLYICNKEEISTRQNKLS